MGSERERVPIIVDDWPDQVPVTPAEFDVIETYLGRLLDEILSPSGKPSRREPLLDTRPILATAPAKGTSP